MRLLILLGAALAGVLLFLLATASGNTTVFANHYPLLLGLNAALAALLAVLVAWQIRTLWRKYIFFNLWPPHTPLSMSPFPGGKDGL